MPKAIIECSKDAPILKDVGIVTVVPDGAAITITTDCSTCNFCVRGGAGTKLSCGHPGIQADRPYIDNVGGNGRKVVADTRPTWCPLG